MATQPFEVIIDLSNVPSSELAREMARRSRPSHAARRVLKPCRFCTLPFGVRDMRDHLHVCILNPRRRRQRKGDVIHGI
jgi:hypothetical protein